MTSMLMQCVKEDVLKVAFVLMVKSYLMEHVLILLFAQVNFMCLLQYVLVAMYRFVMANCSSCVNINLYSMQFHGYTVWRRHSNTAKLFHSLYM